LNTMKEGRGFVWLSACPATQTTLELTELRHSVYTHHLLCALQDKRLWTPIVGTHDKFLRVSDLYNHLVSKVHTEGGFNPCFSGGFSGYMPIAYFSGDPTATTEEVTHAVPEIRPDNALPGNIDRILNEMRYARVISDFKKLQQLCDAHLSKPSVQKCLLLKGLVLSEKIVAQDVLKDPHFEETVQQLRQLKHNLHCNDERNDTLDARCNIIAAIIARREQKYEKWYNKAKLATEKCNVSHVSKGEAYYHCTLIKEVRARKENTLTDDVIDNLVNEYEQSIQMSVAESSFATEAYCARTSIRMANLILDKQKPMREAEWEKVKSLKTRAKDSTHSEWVKAHTQLLKCRCKFLSGGNDITQTIKWVRDKTDLVLVAATKNKMIRFVEYAKTIKGANSAEAMCAAFASYTRS